LISRSAAADINQGFWLQLLVCAAPEEEEEEEEESDCATSVIRKMPGASSSSSSSAHLLKVLSEDHPTSAFEKAHDIGCMKGIFQIFQDHHHHVTFSRHYGSKRLTSENGTLTSCLVPGFTVSDFFQVPNFFYVQEIDL
jgi:hypothetical protein